jgi:hypothetical protein
MFIQTADIRQLRKLSREVLLLVRLMIQSHRLGRWKDLREWTKLTITLSLKASRLLFSTTRWAARSSGVHIRIHFRSLTVPSPVRSPGVIHRYRVWAVVFNKDCRKGHCSVWRRVMRGGIEWASGPERCHLTSQLGASDWAPSLTYCKLDFPAHSDGLPGRLARLAHSLMVPKAPRAGVSRSFAFEWGAVRRSWQNVRIYTACRFRGKKLA